MAIMDVNMTVVWLVLLVILVVVELITMGLTTIWFAGGALAAALISIPGTPLALQILVFLIVSALLLYFTRPVAVKYFNRDRIRTNVESMDRYQRDQQSGRDRTGEYGRHGMVCEKQLS